MGKKKTKAEEDEQARIRELVENENKRLRDRQLTSFAQKWRFYAESI